MGCQNRNDVSVIRGTSFHLMVGLAEGWGDVALDPPAFEGRLVFRELQDDSFPEIKTLVVPPTPATDHRFPGLEFMLDFTMTPQETGSLPDFSMVCFCELRSVDGAQVRRLFEGSVMQRD
jgi:hypothetical protein